MAMKDVSDEQVLLAVVNARSRNFGPGAIGTLAVRSGQPDKVAFRCLERAERRGLIECGTSLNTAWPTREGLRLLAGWKD